MATNEGRPPNDPREPHAGRDRTVDPTPSSTDPFGTRPGDVRGDDTLRGAGPREPATEPRPGDPARVYPDRTYAETPPRRDHTAHSAKRPSAAWAWAIGAVIVVAVVLGFFLMEGSPGTDVPATGSIQEPGWNPAPIGPEPSTPVTPAEPMPQ